MSLNWKEIGKIAGLIAACWMGLFVACVLFELLLHAMELVFPNG